VSEVDPSGTAAGTLRDVGVALSGGGSRAAAFHCGTVRALDRLGLLERVATVSSVSGGSVFAAGWFASMARNENTAQFLDRITRELRLGFLNRALASPRLLALFAPGYNRTDLLAGVYRKLCCDLTLGGLPAVPRLCINVSVLNSGQVGRFSKNGFSTFGLGALTPEGSNRPVALDDFPLALATAASAAFPVGLPPLYLQTRRWFSKVPLVADLEGHSTLALSDGGIIENLGTQTLLKSRTFGTPHIIASDAGTKQPAWSPGSLGQWTRSFFMWLLSGSVLERFALVMSNKQTKWMREELFREATKHAPPSTPRRNIVLVRVDTDWETLIRGVPPDRLEELSRGRHGPTYPRDSRSDSILSEIGPKRAALLAEAKREYANVGMTRAQLNAIGTHLWPMSADQLRALAQHAYWQVLATFALYWEPWPDDVVSTAGAAF
jgi:predicted acylesterase/phospholipase RssA